MANSVAVWSLVCFQYCCITLLAFPVEKTDDLKELDADKTKRLMKRLKRSSTRVSCSASSNLNPQNVNLSDTEFLSTAEGGLAYYFPMNGSYQWVQTNVMAPNDSTVRGTPLCPFDFQIILLPQGYIPSSVNFAACRMQTCGGHSCQPIDTTVQVLRPNGCRNGMQLYEMHPLTVPTSCACVIVQN